MKKRIDDKKIILSTLITISVLILFSTLMPLVFAQQQVMSDTMNEPRIDLNLDQPPQTEPKIFSYDDHLRTRKRLENVIDDYLSEELAKSNSTDQLEVIVQFLTKIKGTDLELLESLDIDVLYQFEFVPAVFAQASKQSILDLSKSPRIYWLEFNEPIEFLMDMSLSTVNATKTWNTQIRDEYGNNRAGIDGTGVSVVVLDTGIDAGHPDLDYKEKTIINLKSDFGVAPWVEMENTDTSYGHGTHCAGTVAGNGDASAGARRGVAPGASLIGLSIGDFGVNLVNAVGGYEWLYQNSKPYTGDPNDINIRVVSNSWGPASSKFDPTDVISQMIYKCTVDKNVVSVFAAGNSGEDDHDGHKVETNPYGSTPMSIMIAATERDGSGMAYFSSRGEIKLNETWPDVAAPGVGIWSAAARRTYISVMKNLQDISDLDPYYFAIGGTSMATPHVAGAVALLFQACPSLKLSDQHEDFSNLDNESYTALGEDWFDSPITLVHEAELILEATTKYIDPSSDNGVPDNNTIGWTSGISDFAQGYGLINVEHAVALALTLNELRTRDFDEDGIPDHPNASVYDAIKQYANIIIEENTTSSGNKLISHWEGDWSRFTEQATSPNALLSTDQSHLVFIPEDADKLTVSLLYEPFKTTDSLFSAAGIRLVIDYDGDGTSDWQGSMSPNDQPDEIVLSSGGFGSNLDKLWTFNIEGYGFGLPNLPPGNLIGDSYYEITVEYSVDLEIIFDTPVNRTINLDFSSFDTNDPRIANLRFGGITSDLGQDGLNLYGSFFNLRNVQPLDVPEQIEEKKKPQTPWWVWLLLAIALLILMALFYRKYKEQEHKEESET